MHTSLGRFDVDDTATATMLFQIVYRLYSRGFRWSSLNELLLPVLCIRDSDIHTFSRVYASVFYSHFAALGVNVTVEDASYHGNVDMSVDFERPCLFV